MRQNAFQLLLKQKRFDLIYKYLYIKYPDNEFVKIAYTENIRAFNNFYEIEPSDGVEKNSIEDFMNSFDKLYESIKNKGFDSTFGTIPIGDNNEISDGAHRLAVCAYLNQEIETEPDGRNDLYDYKFFQAQKMDPDIMDYGALEYVKLNPNTYIVNLWPVNNKDKDELVEEILKKYGFIYYKKELKLEYNACVNLKKLSYGSFWDKEDWIGTVENKYAGAQMHAQKSMGENPLRVFVFVCDSLDNVIKAKEEIRALYNIGNFSVHINDTREEAIWLAQSYFNQNSFDLISKRCFYYEDYRFDNLIEDLKNLAKEKDVNIEDICASGSTPMNIAGIRSSDDLDFLYCGNEEFNVQTETLSNHDSELKYYPYSKKEIIQNPKNHFYYHGLKFISLDVLYAMKKRRGEKPKDITDCKLIKQFKHKNSFYFPNFSLFKKEKNGNKRKITLFGFIKISYKKKEK